jgi:hypothetical protein
MLEAIDRMQDVVEIDGYAGSNSGGKSYWPMPRM